MAVTKQQPCVLTSLLSSTFPSLTMNTYGRGFLFRFPSLGKFLILFFCETLYFSLSLSFFFTGLFLSRRPLHFTRICSSMLQTFPTPSTALLGCHPYLQVMTHLTQHSALLGGLSLNFCCETADLPFWLESLHSYLPVLNQTKLNLQ